MAPRPVLRVEPIHRKPSNTAGRTANFHPVPSKSPPRQAPARNPWRPTTTAPKRAQIHLTGTAIFWAGKIGPMTSGS